jgi:hypothetical protein
MRKFIHVFVDFKKAFDSVWHEGLYLKLLENGIGGRFYDLIKDLYSNTNCADIVLMFLSCISCWD